MKVLIELVIPDKTIEEAHKQYFDQFQKYSNDPEIVWDLLQECLYDYDFVLKKNQV